MATNKSIRESFDLLVDSVYEAHTLAHALLDAAGDKPPYILSAFASQMWRMQTRMEQFEALMHQKALPVLDDFYAVRGTK